MVPPRRESRVLFFEVTDWKASTLPAARKELASLPAKLIQRVFPTIEAAGKQPRPKGCRKLTTEEHLWRIRMGDYRVIDAIDDDKQAIDIIAVRHRSKAYQ
jgi:mRNA interferase RelE/StbE